MAAKGILRIDLADESLEFNKEDITITEREHGISILPKQGKEIGFLRLFYPWSEIRRLQEIDG